MHRCYVGYEGCHFGMVELPTVIGAFAVAGDPDSILYVEKFDD